MKSLVLAVALLPSPALACDVLQDKFMQHWQLTKSDIVYQTTDTVSNEPVFVVDAMNKLPKGRYAIVFQDSETCTFDVVNGEIDTILYYLEMHAFNRP